MHIPPIRPGLESLASFPLKKVEEDKEIDDVKDESQDEKEYISNDESARSLRRRPWINNGSSDKSAGSESESKKVLIPRRRLPQGVVRGCKKCDDCQKVIAKWCPEEACRPELEEAPVFYPTEEEFEDALKYIASIRSTAESYGICRIVPPASWRPPCPLKKQQTWENTKFATRVQRIDELQNRYSMRKKPTKNKCRKRKRRRRRRCMEAKEDGGCDSEETRAANDEEMLDDDEGFGFEPGPDFTLQEFQAYAQDFKTQYFRKSNSTSNRRGRVCMSQGHCDPSIEEIEGEYWRMVQRPTEKIEVIYGADLETGVFNSGFPKNSDQVDSVSDVKYVNSGWNLNNLPRLPGSILSYECGDISGVLVPWLYVGMCFSSFCWHVEDHHLYSLNYMHWGEPKIWYGVPAADALKLEETMRKHLPDLFEEQPDLLHKLVTQLSPSILRKEEVPVYRCAQNAGEFVLTFPRAYHAGFNCGFNCAEAVNVAPVDWLPHGQNAVEVYREEGRKTTISHDKLLLGAAKEAIKACWEMSLFKKQTLDNLRWMNACGKDGMLFKALESRVEMEKARRESLCISAPILKMESSFDATTERECSVCFYDLHLSAAGCHNCSPDKYACLNHAKKLCSCSWGAKFFLFRYNEVELNMLVEALGGNLAATMKWARIEGITLTSYKLKENSQVMNTKPILNIENGRGKEDSLNSSKVDDATCLIQRDKLPGESSSPQHMKGCSRMRGSSDETEDVKVSYQCKEESPSDSGTPMCLENVTFAGNSNHKPKKTKPAFKAKTEAMSLTDDQAENLSTKPAERKDLVWGTGKRARSLVKAVASKSRSKTKDQANGETDIRLNQQNGFSKDDVEKKECISSPKGPQILESKPVDNIRNALVNSAGTSNNLDEHLRQRGPRMAVVVRHVNCKAEPQEFGVVHAGNLWCDAKSIYPKGFRSRVRCISVLDVTSSCYYVSEIIADGHDRPLFMASLEDSPDIVFVDVSATKCWELVRERINKEILNQHKLRTPKLPHLQLPGSLDGMEMFGFTSPAIVKVIQAMDCNRVCTEYWKSRPLMQVPDDNGINILNTCLKAGESIHQQNIKSHQLDMGVNDIIDGLLKKASREELHAMYTVLNNIDSTQVLNKEIEQRLR